MDYLKSFIIGSSGLVLIQHFLPLYLLKNKKNKSHKFPIKLYSILAPLYYGFMSMFALYIGKEFNLSLEKRLFMTSIISIIIISSIAYFKKIYNYTKITDWLYYFIRNGSRHIIAFNLIILNLEKYFSKLWALRVFTIGSSAVSYLITFFKVIYLDSQNKVNYDYNLFTVIEPFIQGFELLTFLWILNKQLNISLFPSLIIGNFLASLVWFILARTNKTYKYKNTEEWLIALTRVIVTRIALLYPMYYVLTNVK